MTRKQEVLIIKAYTFIDQGQPLPDYLQRLLAANGIDPGALVKGGEAR